MLATAYRNIQNSLTWVKQYLDYTTGAIERLSTAVETTKTALEKERRRIIDSVLEGYNGSSASSSSRTELPTFHHHDTNELPPPVYEAPPTITTTGPAAGSAEPHPNQVSMPDIPNNITPASSISNFPLNEHSPVIPPALPSPVDNSAPPHPITPVFGNTLLNQPSYISTNTNNPFR